MGVGVCEISPIFANGNVYRYLLNFLLASFKLNIAQQFMKEMLKIILVH